MVTNYSRFTALAKQNEHFVFLAKVPVRQNYHKCFFGMYEGNLDGKNEALLS